MPTDSARWLTELCARVALAGDTASLLVLVTSEPARINEVRKAVVALLQHEGCATEDLGALDTRDGPTAWNERARSGAGVAHVFSIAPSNKLGRAAFAEIANAQRESLREATGPLVLLLATETEVELRRRAPDFVTWIAQSWSLPSAEALVRMTQERGAVAPVPTATAAPIRFLHLSDLHLRTAANKRVDQERVLRGLVEMLSRTRAAAPLDLIFVTGDLAFSANSEEYALVTSFIARLLEVTGVPRERVFVVPGNHDVDRAAGRWLLRTLDSDEASTEFFGIAANRRWHAQKFEAWSAAMRAALGDRSHGLAVGAEAVENVEVRGTRIAVALFNTAWFACAGDDEGKLWLGEANVESAAAVAARAELSIALMHHPIDCLAEAERDAVSAHLERSFDVLLRGHLHKTRAQVVIGGRGALAEIAAPAAYQGSRWANGCFVGEVRPDARTLRMQPFTFGLGADPWTVDNRVFPSDERDGHAHTFRLGERAPTSEREAVAQANAADLFWRLPSTRRLAIAARLGVESASTRETEERAAERLVRSPEGAEVLREFSVRASAPRVSTEVGEQLVSSAFRAAIRDCATERFSRADPAFFVKALTAVGRVWTAVPRESRPTASLSEAVLAIAEVLAACIDGPVSAERSPWNVALDPRTRRLRVDLLIGDRRDPPHERAVLEVDSLLEYERDESRLLGRLDSYRGAFDARHAGLILLGSRDQSTHSIDAELTPAQHIAFVLTLP